MATGFAGLKQRVKTFDKTCSNGDTIIYTAPSDVIFATIYVTNVEFLNADANENTSIYTERTSQSSFRVLKQFGSITLNGLAGTNNNVSIFPSYEKADPTLDNYINDSNGIGFSGNIGGSITVAQAVAGDRVRVNVVSSGETARWVGFIVEEYTGSVTAL